MRVWRPQLLRRERRDEDAREGRYAEPLLFSEADLYGISATAQGSLLFLGALSLGEIDRLFEKVGVYRHLEKQGYRNFQLTMDARDYFLQRLALYGEGSAGGDLLLGEVVLKRRHLTADGGLPLPAGAQSAEILVIEWLTFRHPLGRFTADRPQLPGQETPGLGLGRLTLRMFLALCRRTGTIGILNTPEYFHNAQMYARAAWFIDPLQEARRRAIARDLLARFSLAQVSEAIDAGAVLENRQPFRWFSALQVLPATPELRRHFRKGEYLQACRRALETFHYQIDDNCLKDLHL